MAMNDCKKFQETISGYVDGEIPAELKEEITRHLGICPPCAEIAAQQAKVKDLVKTRCNKISAPSYLRAHIQHDLSHLRETYGFASLVRNLFDFQPRLAFAVLTSLLVVTASLTYLGAKLLGDRDDPYTYQTGTHLAGEILCADCELLLRTSTSFTHDSTHRVVIRCSQGKLWSILQTPKGRELINAAKIPAQKVEVYGHVFPQARYVQVMEFKMI